MINLSSYFSGKKQHVCLAVNNICNWNCDYCDIPHVKNGRNIKLEDINKYSYIFEVLNKFHISFALAGGEPGLLHENIINEIFKRTKNCKIKIFTNGTFINKGYHEKYHNQISHLCYHISSDLEPIKIKKISKLSNENITYVIVINKNNKNNLEDFLKINSHLNIHKTYARSKIKEQEKSIINITSKELRKKQEICSKLVIKPQINFVGNEILHCACGYLDVNRIELTKENFILSIFGYGNKLFNITTLPNICKHCDICDDISFHMFNIIKKRQLFNKYKKDILSIC